MIVKREILVYVKNSNKLKLRSAAYKLCDIFFKNEALHKTKFYFV